MIIGNGQTIFSKEAVFRSFLVALWIIALTYPIFSNRYIPFVDFPNHAARLHILANPDLPILARYYEIDKSFIGNSTMDLFVRVTNWQGDVYDLMRWSFVFYLVNFQLAALLLNRIIWGRFSTWPLIAGLAAYNAPLFWGFQNYFLAIPLALYVLAAWIAATELRLTFRVLLMAAPIFLIYALHSIAFAFLAIAIGGIEIERFIRSRDGTFWHRFCVMLALTLPFWLPIAHLLSQQFLNDTGRGTTYTAFGGLNARAAALVSVTMAPGENISHWIARANLISTSILFLPAFLFVRRGPALNLAPGTVGMLVAVGLSAAFAPEWLAGVWAINLRLGFVLFLLFVAATRWEAFSPAMRRVAIASAGLMLLLRVVSMESYLRDFSREIDDMLALTKLVEPGAAVSILPEERWAWDRVHIADYAAIERQAYISTLFVGAHGLTINREQSKVALAKIAQSRCAPGSASEGYFLSRDQNPAKSSPSRNLQFVAQRGKLTLFEGCQNVKGSP